MISIIIPVYNVEKYIRRCLNSILQQTYSDLEVILVDDGSTDSSGDICDEYARTDPRFHVIHQNNGGPSCTRNIGIKHASGDYISFIDSDDFLEQDTYCELLKAIEETSSDFSVCNYFEVFVQRNGSLKKVRRGIYNDITQLTVCLDKDIYTKIFMYNTTLWNKLFKRSLLNGICFDESLVYAEDSLFVLQAVRNAKKAVITPYIGYNYVLMRDGSIVSSSINSSVFDLLKANTLLYMILHSEGCPEAGVWRIHLAVKETLNKIPDFSDKEYIKYISACVTAAQVPTLKDKIKFIICKDFSLKDRLKYLDLISLKILFVKRFLTSFFTNKSCQP